MRSKKVLWIIMLCLMLILSLAGCTTKKAPVQEQAKEVDLSVYKNGDLFITPQELNEKLSDENLVLLDANKPDLYKKGHIPGAISIGFHSLSNTVGKPGDKGWGTSLDKESLKEKLESLGVNNDKEVVIYSDVLKGPGPDGRNVWQLRMFGLDNVKLLYGGLEYWKNLGYDVSKETVQPTPTTGLVLKDPDPSYYATLEYVHENLGKTTIMDVRTKKEFDGSTAAGEARGGHIKGAVWLEWKDLLNEDATPKSPEEIIAIMDQYGIKPEDDFVVY